jgi:hypothetical protein
LLKRDFREDIYPLTSHVEEKKDQKKRGANAESIKTHDLIGQDGKDKGIKNEKMKKKRLPIWNRNKPTGNQSTE